MNLKDFKTLTHCGQRPRINLTESSLFTLVARCSNKACKKWWQLNVYNHNERVDPDDILYKESIDNETTTVPESE